MKTLYEVLNVDLAQEYTKERKLAVVATLDLDAQLEIAVKEEVEAMDIPENDDRHHWIQKLGRAAGADLLTIGKVQPENMLAMAALGEEDFKAAVKVATGSARTWNQNTVSAEKELNQETIPDTLV
jgi:hypothetical protein